MIPWSISLLVLLGGLSGASADEPRVAPQPALNLVEQAAAALAAGRDNEATDLMARHVEENPSELIVRAQLAELLFRQGYYSKARPHFERFLADAQQQPDIAFRYIIHGHSRLVAIGEKLELSFDEHFHRGIGLYLLARRRAAESNPEGEPAPAALLARAARELQAARDESPRDARTHLHLYRVWKSLGETQSAYASLDLADRFSPSSSLTPSEARELAEACLTQQLFRIGPGR